LLAAPFGEDGLKTDDAREVVNLLNSTPVGDHTGYVLIGPMDRVSDKASDVLLKSLEEADPNRVCPILWAHDVGGVRPTVRSRCLVVWCPSTKDVETPFQGEATKIYTAIQNDDFLSIVDTVLEAKGREYDLLDAVAKVIVTKSDFDLWPRVRDTLTYQNVTALEAISCLLPEVDTL
jgi:hypothetical protein